MTAQVPSVAQTRRALSFIRRSWDEQQTNGKRFFLSDPLAEAAKVSGQSIEHFSLAFVLAHHTRRINQKN